MKWDNDEYGYLKLQIFEYLRKNISQEDAEKISIASLMKEIDVMISNLMAIDDRNKIGRE